MEKIKFEADDGSIVEFYVEEQTKIRGISYLLVSDAADGEANAYILKDTSEDDSPDACYVLVDDDDEIEAVFHVFEQMMEDVAFRNE
ncbi:MAG: DUF1292 domain-containing protein [Blautia sp.]|nr:DUF1292 domain-containing protein [Blautia sp.]